MKRISDVRYVQPERMTVALGRMCYPIALAIEQDMPATARKLLEAVSAAEMSLFELCTPIGHGKRARARKRQRAIRAIKCARAILHRLATEVVGDPARVTAAVEIAERVLGMLEAGELA
jgi:hypothetical protein